MKIAFLLVLAFVGACIAASPTNPVWPKAFSSSVIVESDRNHQQPYFFRLFSDNKLQATRRDGTYDPAPGVFIFTQSIANFTTKVETDIYYSRDTTGCQTRSTFGNFPEPDFSNYNYAGPVLIGYTTAYRWVLRNNTNDVFSEIFVDSLGDPVRFLAADREGHREVWTFTEFDAGAQDPDLFVIPTPIQSICVPAPSPPPRTTTGARFQMN